MRMRMRMKAAVAASMALMLSVGTADASIVAFDNFDYPDGSLVPNGGWANHSGTAGDLLVESGQAVVQHGTPSEDANKPFATGTGAIYYGIDFSIDDLTAPFAGTDFEYFAHFSDGGTFNFVARLDVQAPTGSGDYTVGIATASSTADATWGTDLTYGTVYRAIVRYDQDGSQAQLWINPALESDTSILGADLTDPGLTVSAFALRQSDSSENETIRVDNLVVGTTFGDVLHPVPEPATLALMAFGGLALLRRRR